MGSMRRAPRNTETGGSATNFPAGVAALCARHFRPGGDAGRTIAKSPFGDGGMATNIKQIIYFHPRLDATAAAIRNKRSDIDMFRRDFGGPAADTWADMSRAHGYHACARTEMREPWFPGARLFAKAPSLLAVCSLGAGYDLIDVDSCT